MKWLRAALVNLSLAGVSLALLLGAAEIALRTHPEWLPIGFYGSSRYQPELLATVHSTRLIYNRVRFVEREPNDEGFLDVHHERAKPHGTVRVGFFGDSYVEAAQVPLEQTFYRRLPREIAGRPIEALAIGISGWGTLHGLNAYRVFASRYGLDVAVYLFVENDPGDNDFWIQRVYGSHLTPKAYADLGDDPPGYTLQWNAPPEQRSVAYRMGKVFQDHLLTAQFVLARLVLLGSEGVERSPRKGAQSMTERAGAVPDQNDLPSTWPDRYRAHASELARRILADWATTVRRDGRKLLVLYVPRGEMQLTGELSTSDTWLPWLQQTTSALGIPLIDPSEPLARRLAAGDHVYDDHWTPAGHEVIARVLAEALGRVLELDASAP
jgi:hypothetical protein